MRKAQQQEILDCINSLHEAQREIGKAFREKKFPSVQNMLSECQEFAVSIGDVIECLEGKGHITVTYLESYCELLFAVFKEIENNRIQESKIVKRLDSQLLKIENSVKSDIILQKETVFLPYNASMWGCFESAWIEAEKDENCNAYVVPIPYFEKNPDGSLGKMHYEGDRYPDYVLVTDWTEYSIPKRRPDEIYIHNPYDDMNYVTSVHPAFYTDELKKYTDMLIYIPYFIGVNDCVVGHFCTTPGVLHADRVIVESEKVKKIYIEALAEFEETNKCKGIFGDWNKKIIVAKSSKIERVTRVNPENIALPEEWKSKIYDKNGLKKKIIFYNTTIDAVLKHRDIYLDKVENVLKIFREENQVILLWRPHPLLAATLNSMRPELYCRYMEIVTQYKEEDWGIYDETADIDRAIVISDAYYGDWSSVVEMYKATGKPIMIQNCEIDVKNAID